MAGTPEFDAETLRIELQSFSSRLDMAVVSATRMREAECRVFFSGLAAAVGIARVAQLELDRRAATRFSVFDFFHECETDLSRVFGGLLDPTGNHGQGSRFLGLFLNEVFRGVHESQSGSFPTSNFEGCKVHLEYATDEGRRIDIVLELPGNRWIGIENKPWAEEQERQVADYLQYLRDRAASGQTGDAWLVYLSGDGSDPRTLPDSSDERNHCVTMGYRTTFVAMPSTEEWIRQCLQECEAERVRWFLKDVLEYLRRSFHSSNKPVGKREEGPSHE